LAARLFLAFGLVILAAAVAKVVALLGMLHWIEAFVTFVLTKIIYDIISVFNPQGRKYLFFEDYLRETLLYIAVAGISVAGAAAVEIYMGGAVWLPLLAAGLVFVWR